jgi:hypothetical protein
MKCVSFLQLLKDHVIFDTPGYEIVGEPFGNADFQTL